MTINERVKELRKALKLTQDQFAEELNITRSSLSVIEIGKTAVTERNIKEICNKFNVNQDWIRYGEGEMFREMSFEEELAEYFGEVITNTSDSSKEFQRRLIHALSKLDDTDWKVLEKIADQLLEKNKK
jgi:transcriptional regulator with XRE-family HTH domain